MICDGGYQGGCAAGTMDVRQDSLGSGEGAGTLKALCEGLQTIEED